MGTGFLGNPGARDGGEPPKGCEALDGGCQFLPPVDAGPACGDGIIDEGEECDDGNSRLGDGCSGACKVEPFSECAEAGQPCKSTIICGSGALEGSEVCDDGNTEDGDGCSADCLSKHPHFDCTDVGKPCISLVKCNDGLVTGDEACDDNGAMGGCKDDCSGIEDGWICLRPGTPCIRAPFCGDTDLARGEQCEDGNGVSGDGCSDSCQVEPEYLCSGVGVACIKEVCGDGTRTLNEQCDDMNEVADDGCTSCQLDPGWTCPDPGKACSPRCGDGMLLGQEQCDDGNLVAGDGCSPGCAREAGFACPTAGAACSATVCPDGTASGDEGCDDGNTIAGDGCGPTCQREPTFVDGAAVLSCGDGLITGAEQCDDGNDTPKDGCSATCQVEEGFTCSTLQQLPAAVQFAVTLRDFKARNAAGGHVDFERSSSGSEKGIAGEVCTADNVNTCGRLDGDGKPQLSATADSDTVDSAESYAMWFRDDDAPAEGADVLSLQDSLVLNQTAPGLDVYTYTSEVFNDDGAGGHFPLDENAAAHGVTCGNEVNSGCCGGQCEDHNYHFTTELRYFFQYQGGETLTFRGDDDVWVFINGRLAVDIGGVHCSEWGRVVLGDQDASCSVHGFDGDADCSDAGELADCAADPEELALGGDSRFGLTKGGVYEIVLFHAERKLSHSHFQLTLAGFLAPRSACLPICGDGLVNGGEVCDDGPDNMDDTYGVCNTTCTQRLFCGDGIKNGPEICDNGFNVDVYALNADSCAAECMPPPYCGDAVLQSVYEACDDGTELNTGAYDGCTATCELGPYCGDGTKDEEHGEFCDKGVENGGYGKECGFDCQPAPFCGDGIKNGPEDCDLGADKNTGEYGGCNPDCTHAPRCGDAAVQPEEGEECDDGVNDGGYGECAPECKLGPLCGDGQVQGPEQCDDGVNDGGYGECARGCRLGPFCGDNETQTEAGEECDDGNDRNSDGCDSSCRIELAATPTR